MLDIFIDADACPVKEEVYRVAQRCELHVKLVANSRMRVPADADVELVVVPGDFDAADDWIAENVDEDDIVITADIPLAGRCLKRGAVVLDHRGGAFTEDNIGEALATREILSELRDLGSVTRGPAPFDKRQRSAFLQKLDDAVQAARRRHRGREPGRDGAG